MSQNKSLILFILFSWAIYAQDYNLSLTGAASDSALLQARKMINSNVLYVGTNGGYSTIASALSAASSGNIIFVYPGTYSTALTLVNNVRIKGLTRESVIISGAITVPTRVTSKLSSLTTSGNITLNGSSYLSCGDVSLGNSTSSGIINLNDTSTFDIKQSDIKIGTIAVNNRSYFDAEVGEFNNGAFSAYDTSVVNIKFRNWITTSTVGYAVTIGKFNPHRPDTNTTELNEDWAEFNGGHKVKATFIGDSTGGTNGAWWFNDSSDVTFSVRWHDKNTITAEGGAKLCIYNTTWTGYLNLYEAPRVEIYNSHGYYDKGDGLGSHNIETAPYPVTTGGDTLYKGQLVTVRTPLHFLDGIIKATLIIRNSTIDFTGRRGRYWNDWGMPLALATPTDLIMENCQIIRGQMNVGGSYNQLFALEYYQTGKIDNCTFIQEVNDPNNRVRGFRLTFMDTSYSHKQSFSNVRMTNCTFRNTAVGGYFYSYTDVFDRDVYSKDTVIINNVFCEYDSINTEAWMQKPSTSAWAAYASTWRDSLLNNIDVWIKFNSE